MKALPILVLAFALSTFAVAADDAILVTADTVASVLNRHSGQKVELRLKSGDKLSGVVKKTSEGFVHLAALTGQEFYDALIRLDDVSAIVFRNDGK